MGWFIFAFIAFIMLIEITVGALRGFKYSAIRLVFTLLAAFLAALFAKKVTLLLAMKLAETSDLKGTSLSEVVNNLFEGSGYEDIAATIAPHLAGLSLSFLIPVVFIVMFLLFKLVSLILYAIVKAIIENIMDNHFVKPNIPELAALERKKMIKSRIAGGFLGAVVGLMIGALMFVPVFNVTTAFTESGAKNSLISFLENTEVISAKSSEQTVALEYALKQMEYGNTIPAKADTDDAVMTATELGVVVKVIEETAASPAILVFKYSGLQTLATEIMNRITVVTTEDIGAKATKSINYNFSESIADILDLLEPLSKIATAYMENENFALDNLDLINEFADRLNKTTFLSDEDKMVIINACKSMVKETIFEQLGIANPQKKDYASLDELKKDVETIKNIGELLASAAADSTETGAVNDGPVSLDLENIDPKVLLEDTDKMQSFISSTLSLKDGSEIVSSMINNNVSKYTNGKIKDVTTPEVIESVGQEALVRISEEILVFTKYDEKTEMTDEIKQEVNEALETVYSNGLITEEMLEEIREEYELN